MYEAYSVLIDTETHEDWLEARRKIITASDAAAITGDSPFSSFADIVRRKISGTQIEQNQSMWFGHQREKGNLRIFELLSRVEAASSQDLWVRKDCPVGATFDAYVTSVQPDNWWDFCTAPESIQLRDLPYDAFHFGTPIELKNVASKNRSLWNKEQPPRIYWCQMQAQLLVSGEPLGILVAAVDSCEMYVHVIQADPAYQAKLVDCAQTAVQQIQAAWF